MPGIFSLQPNRRQFLRQSTVAGLSIALAGCASRHYALAGDATLRLALLSDTHIPADADDQYRGFKPVENLARVLPAVRAMKPDGVLINGDAARLEGRPDDYARLRDMLAPVAGQTPVYIGLGNHDHHANFIAAFNDRPGARADVENKHLVVIEHPAVRVIQLDSLLYVNKVAGLLGRAQRDWLGRLLATADARPTVLFVHHTLGDDDGDLLDSDRLFDLLRPHRQVKAIFYGHSHVWQQSERQNVKLINLPAVGYNFRDEDPVGWVEARFNPAGVDLTLHAIAGNTAEDGRTTLIGWN
jgi:3',5'-cyclic AMP phosphodiesterase CpdA